MFCDRMPVKSVVSWNSMISCYLQNGYYRDALDVFSKMCNSGIHPNETTTVSVLVACKFTKTTSKLIPFREIYSLNFKPLEKPNIANIGKIQFLLMFIN